MNLEGTLKGLFLVRVPQNLHYRVHFGVHLGVLEGLGGSLGAYHNTKISKKLFYQSLKGPIKCIL